MAQRLTNRQMDVLAERVTDLLQEAHKAKYEQIKNSEEYKNYSDAVVKEVQDLHKEIIKIEEEKEKLAKVISDLRTKQENLLYPEGRKIYYYFDVHKELANYIEMKKEEKYPELAFNRNKILRKVQADILLSEISNPEQLVSSLVEKLK